MCLFIRQQLIPQSIACGVSQALVPGPILNKHLLYPSDIIRSHNAGFHLYTEDALVYLISDCPYSPDAQCETVARLEACTADIWQWIPLNSPKLNDGKTEFLALHSKYKPPSSTLTCTIDHDEIHASISACNLGVIFDDSLSLHPHVSSVVKADFFSSGVSQICDFLTPSATIPKYPQDFNTAVVPLLASLTLTSRSFRASGL